MGSSRTLRGVLDQVRTVAPTNSTVLIEGETGTGKELIANAIHAHSNRRNRPFVKLNFAAIPLELLESELFGHEKGAFTGAVTQRFGRFEAANGGTLSVRAQNLVFDGRAMPLSGEFVALSLSDTLIAFQYHSQYGVSATAIS